MSSKNQMELYFYSRINEIFERKKGLTLLNLCYFEVLDIKWSR